MKKPDTLGTGLLSGSLLPLITFIIIYMVKFRFFSITEFIKILASSAVLPKLLSLCVIPNLALFFLFIWTNRNSSARGILFATIGLAFIILLLKLLLA